MCYFRKSQDLLILILLLTPGDLYGIFMLYDRKFAQEASMKIFIMTDMEGCAGILNHDDWVCPEGRYYEAGKRLLTAEVNAAIRGFISACHDTAGGTPEIHVADAHGYGGINVELLYECAYLRRGWTGPYPFGLDESFDVIAWVGQHPKAGTEYGHICHTGWFNALDFKINGVSVGEFGQMVYMAQELGVTPVFGSGCLAFTKEAQALVRGIFTVPVKEGLTPGRGDELDCDGYRARNLAAVHMQPKRACAMIEEGAGTALRRYMSGESFKITPEIHAPYIIEAAYRKNGSCAAHTERFEHPSSVIACMNLQYGK